jgi:ankyrin repeat protein
MLNGKDRGDITALHRAAQRGHETIVQLLLANGADVTAKDLSGRTALSVAAEEGHKTILQLLESAGAS